MIDRSREQTGRLFENLSQRSNILIIVNSKCSTESLTKHALSFVREIVISAGYNVRSIPALFIRHPNKAPKLWAAIHESALDSSVPVIHVDDKGPIVNDFQRWSRFGWDGVVLHPARRAELCDLVLPAIANW